MEGKFSVLFDIIYGDSMAMTKVFQGFQGGVFSEGTAQTAHTMGTHRF